MIRDAFSAPSVSGEASAPRSAIPESLKIFDKNKNGGWAVYLHGRFNADFSLAEAPKVGVGLDVPGLGEFSINKSVPVVTVPPKDPVTSKGSELEKSPPK